MKKAISIILTISFVLSLFACLSGLPAYAVDNTPAPKAATQKVPVSTITTTAEVKNAATSGTCGTNVTWEYDTSTNTLTISGTGNMSNYSNSSYNGTYVTTAPWRSYYKTMKTVVINPGVTSIGGDAFYGCTGLTSITIPDSVTSIGESAFHGCTGFTSITIPDSVTSIGYEAFEYCTGLANITIPDSVTSIGRRAFYNCTGLTSVTIPDSVTSISDSMFCCCTSLTSITIPDSVTGIGDFVFSGCTSLTCITIGNSVTNIGSGYGYVYNTFESCTSLKMVKYTGTIVDWCNISFSSSSDNPLRYAHNLYINDVLITDLVIPDTVKEIKNYAFYGCSPLTSITIPDSVASIGNDAFFDCTGLTNITIPDSVTSIGRRVFSGCTGLTSVTIPDSVTSIGGGAFSGCSALEEITLPFVGDKRHSATDTNQYPFGYIFGTSSYTGGTATQQTYYGSSATSTTNTTYYIPSSLKNVTITDSEYIPYGAFTRCTGLTSITLSSGVKTIGADAFWGCTGLKTVYYNGSESGWNKISKSGNDLLTNSTIYYSCGEDAYYRVSDGCLYIVRTGKTYDYKTQGAVPWYNYAEQIKVINIETEINRIGNYAFYCLENLDTVIVKNKDIEFGKYVFNTDNNNIKVFAPNGGNVENYCADNYLTFNIDPHPQPVLVVITANSITVEEQTGYEYSKNGTSWQTSGTFTGLSPATEYSIYSRQINTAEYYADAPYKTLIVKTDKSSVYAPGKPVCTRNTDTEITLQANNIYEYSIDGETWQKSNVFTGLTHKETYTLYQRLAETDTEYASAASEPLVMQLIKKTVNAPAAPDYKSHTEDSITLKANSSYEFSMDGETWQKSNMFTGLEKNVIYRFYQRYAESETAYTSVSSEAIVIAIPDKPEISRAGYEEIRVKKVKGFEYCLDDMVWKSDNKFNMLIDNTEYYVYQRLAVIPGEKVYQITSEYTAVTTDNSITGMTGDIDDDGEITDQDAVYLLFYTFFPEDYPIDQPCDFNGDGKTDDQDAVYLLFYTFFPEDYPIG